MLTNIIDSQQATFFGYMGIAAALVFCSNYIISYLTFFI